jgi:subfamily B ATP-binding cassette protein MsbA
MVPLLNTLFKQENSAETAAQKVTEGQNWISNLKDSIVTSFNNFVLSGDIPSRLIKICALLFITFLLKNVFGYLQAYFLAYAEQGVIRDLRNKVYDHLHKLPMGFFKNEKTGNLISRVTNDVYVVQTSIAAVFLNMIREPLTIIVCLTIAIMLSWRLTLASIIVVPISVIIISWLGLKIRKQSGILQQKMSDITTVLHETITGVKIVKAFGMEEYESKKFHKETQSFFKTNLKIVRIRNIASPTTEILTIIIACFMLYYGGTLVLIDNTLSSSAFLGFFIAISQMMNPIKELSGVNNRIQESAAAAIRVFEILDTEPKIRNYEDSIEKKEFGNSVKFENVSFQYDDGIEQVLDDISFEVHKGQIIAFVGSSGSGKTTLVDLIPRFFDPTGGRILIDGTDIKKIKFEDLRKLMGIVTQETVLFNESVHDNIAYGLFNYPFDKVVAAAKAANAHDFIMELPDKYDTIIGEKGTKLSGGQRQRISIARALLKNPPIMILDEATSALDNESEVLVQEAIERLMHERTTFVIAHRLSTIRNADRIIVLDKGRIVQDGKHDELLLDEDGIYKKLYELQFRDLNG